MAMRQETYRFLRGTSIPVAPTTDAERYGLQDDEPSAEVKAENFVPLKTFVVRGTFDATVQLQGSLDGTNWFNAAASVTTATIIEFESAWAVYRVSISSYVSGEVFVEFGTYTVGH